MIKDKKILFGLTSFLLILSSIILFTLKSEFLIGFSYALMITASVLSIYLKKRMHKTVIALLLGLAVCMLPLQIVLSTQIKSALTNTFTILVVSLSSAVIGLYSYLNKKIYPSIAVGFGILLWASVLSLMYGMQIDKTILLSMILIIGFYPLIIGLEKSLEVNEMLKTTIKSSIIFTLAIILYIVFNLFVLSGVKPNPSLIISKVKEITLSIGIVFFIINAFITTVVVLSSLVVLHMLGLKKNIYDDAVEFEETEDEEEIEDNEVNEEYKQTDQKDEFKQLKKEIIELKKQRDTLDPIVYAEKYSLLKSKFEILASNNAYGDIEGARKLLEEAV